MGLVRVVGLVGLGWGWGKLPQCLFIVSYVVGIDTVVKQHHSQ